MQGLILTMDILTFTIQTHTISNQEVDHVERSSVQSKGEHQTNLRKKLYTYTQLENSRIPASNKSYLELQRTQRFYCYY